jgi:AcrR family transcriptional regulator
VNVDPPVGEPATEGTARSAILAAAVAQARTAGIDGLRIDKVLRDANASSSSLYHHFGSRAGLSDAVADALVEEGMFDEDPYLLTLVETIDSPEAFAAFMAAQLRRLIEDPATVERRRVRLAAAAQGLQAPAVAMRWGDQVGLLHDATGAFVRRAGERGLCNPEIDALAYAVFFTSLSLGQLVSGSRVEAERWLAVATDAALAPLRIPPDGAPGQA